MGGDDVESALLKLQKGMVETQKYLSNPLRQYLWFLPVRQLVTCIAAAHCLSTCWHKAQDAAACSSLSMCFYVLQRSVTSAMAGWWSEVCSLGLHNDVQLLHHNVQRCIGPAAQDVRRGKRDLGAFQDMMRALLAELRARGPPADDDTTIAAHLLRMRDPATGQPLSDDQLLPEVRASERVHRVWQALRLLVLGSVVVLPFSLTLNSAWFGICAAAPGVLVEVSMHRILLVWHV